MRIASWEGQRSDLLDILLLLAGLSDVCVWQGQMLTKCVLQESNITACVKLLRHQLVELCFEHVLQEKCR